MKNNIFILIGSLASVVAGYIHIFIVALGHGSVLPHLITFLIGGSIQMLMGIIIWFNWSNNYIKQIFWIHVVIHGGFFAMLIYSLFFPVPFLQYSEPLGLLGIITFIAQLLAIACLLPKYIRKTKAQLIKTFVLSICLSFFLGAVAFQLGYIGEKLFPNFIYEGHGDLGDHHGKLEIFNNKQDTHVQEMDHHDDSSTDDHH